MYSNRFKETRIKRGLTQKQLADSLEISNIAIQNYESQRRKPSYDILIALADCLDVSIDYLVGRTDNPKINR